MKIRITLLALIALFTCNTILAEEPIIKFGVVTDLHYSPKHAENKKHPSRMYKITDKKLQEAVNTFNQQNVDFTAILGDIIDKFADSFEDIRPILKSLNNPYYIALGNHDFLDVYGTKTQKETLKTLGVKKPYYSFVKNNVRFIVLDSNDLSLYSRDENTPEGKEIRELYNKMKAAKIKNASKYNGTLSQKQIDWMIKLIEKSQKKGQQVICLAHMPLRPTISATDMRGKEISQMLEKYSNVKAYCSGHHHEGSEYLKGSVKYYNFKGMIEGMQNHYAIVSLYKDRIEIQGFGDQESKTIKF